MLQKADFTTRLAAALILALCCWAAAPGQAAAQSGPQPNIFELRGAGTTVTYTTKGIDGKARLTYRAGSMNLDFVDKDIQVTKSGGVSTVSVVIQNVPDVKTVTFTMLLPSFNLPPSGMSPIRTIGILTTDFSTIGGPRLVAGPLSEFASRPLTGTAKFVMF